MEQLTIERLLKVSSRLNQSSASTSSSSADTGRLSLKQLISVHESLLDSVSSAKTSASRDIGNVEISSIIPNYITSLDESKRQNVVSEIVGSVVNDEKELKICQDLLLSENHQDCDSILMVVQYLLRLSKAWNGNGNNTSSSPISDIEKLLLDITSITYPLIVSSKFDVQLRDAILDASFLQISSSSPDVNEEVDMGQSGNNQLNNYKRLHDTLTHCLILINQCVSSALSISMQDATKSVSNTLEWILVVVEVSSRILSRLLEMFKEHDIDEHFSGSYCNDLSKISSEQREECQQRILECMHKLSLSVLHSLCYYDNVPLLANGRTTLLRPVTALLLPALIGESGEYNIGCKKSEASEQKQVDRMISLWNFVYSLIVDDEYESMIKNDKQVESNQGCQRKCRTWEKTAPSTASGVLCVIAESIHSLPLTVPESLHIQAGECSSMRLVEHPVFWNFIKKTLSSEDIIGVDYHGMKGGGKFSSRGNNKNDNPYSEDSTIEDEDVDQLVRRRSIHILSLIIEKEYEFYNTDKSNGIDRQEREHIKAMVLTWKKYILCFEALEMEDEAHLVDQVWDTVIELCAACRANDNEIETTTKTLPSMSWEMVGSLFARVLLSDSPTLRKLGLFRLLSGRAGIALNDEAPKKEENIKTKKGNSKGQKSKKKKQALKPSPISIISPSFILNVLAQSYDSLSSASGFNFVNEGKTTNHDISSMIGPFISSYTRSLVAKEAILNNFMKQLLSSKFINSVRFKTLVMMFRAVAYAWSNELSVKIYELTSETINEAVETMYKVFHSGSIVYDYHQSLLLHFALILSKSRPGNHEKKPNPFLILDTLILYISTDEVKKQSKEDLMAIKGLEKWIEGYGDQWILTVCCACAASFVSGQIVPFGMIDESIDNTLVLTTVREREIVSAISKLCSLAGAFIGSDSPSSMLWPAINKGLGNISVDTGLSLHASRQAARALILLTSGCREYILNGIGHGDLLVDNKTGNMVPPPPTIEMLLSCAIKFLLDQLDRVAICDMNRTKNDEIAKSRAGSYFPNHFSLLINQLICLKRAYPSSVIMSNTICDLIVRSLENCTTLVENNDVEQMIGVVKSICLLHGALAFADETMMRQIAKEKNLMQCCSELLKLNFNIPAENVSQYAIHNWQLKAMRSIFQHAKWGSLSLLVPQSYVQSTAEKDTIIRFHNSVIDTTLDAVNATPTKGLISLFECALSSAKNSFDLYNRNNEKEGIKEYTRNLRKIIDTLFVIMNDTAHNPTRAYMLQCTCSLIFCSQRLAEEYDILHDCIKEGVHPTKIDLPIRDAFRKLINMAGSIKPYISKYALSYISAAWLGNSDNVGLVAIPYRQDIAKLLIHKESKLDETMTHKEGLVQDEEIQREGGFATVPNGTPDTSVARGFLLTFISKLPNVDDGLSDDVRSKLCHFLILWLLDNICLDSDLSTRKIGSGSVQYCQILRAWQALCVLSRFVTAEIVEKVSQKLCKAMSFPLHGQIRYFVEIFTIQCIRRHTNILGQGLLQEIKNVDLSQQYVCSIMIVAGNLIVGKYSKDFINSPSLKQEEFDIKQFIAAVIPWLGSTQSFCRAIAQLLIHKLVPIAFPMVNNSKSKRDMEEKHKDWFFVYNTWMYLDKNSEMQKLRKKQLRFFEEYDADSVCTPEGIFSFPIDEGDESNPPYLVDALKRCLQDIGNENAAEVPDWREMEQLLQNIEIGDDMDTISETDLVNFQRKILPVDTLNLTLESYKQQKLQNAAGRYRQSLIVCASLIDKVTNLGGITRTAEIFAADKVVVPDEKMRKMDNFKSISVGAGEWIKIEECKEAALLSWLKQRKKEGYTIVGVEQTSSSKCLSHVKFEGKSVLLLGKEKEGIPQQYLNIVDQCVEIPQLGIIRSLNVHVSAAIVMWEYTKQMMIADAYKN